MSSILAFDTLEYSKALQDAGMDRTLAELIAKKQSEVFENVRNPRQLVTKQDLQLEIEKVRAEVEKVRGETEKVRADLTQNIEKVRADLTQNIKKVRADLTQNIEKVRSDLKLDIEKLRGEFRTEIEKSRAEAAKMNHSMLKWMIGIWASMGLGLLLAMAKGFHWLGM